MRSAWWCHVSWSLLAVGAGQAVSAADDRASNSVLTGKGLVKQSSTYVLADGEKPVLAKLREARGAYQGLAAMSSERAQNQQMAAQAEDLEQQRAMLQLQLEGLTQQTAPQPPGASPGGPGAAAGGGAGRGMGLGTGGTGGGGPGGGQATGSSSVALQREQVRQQLLQVMNEQRVVKNLAAPTKEDSGVDTRIQKAEEKFRTTLTDLRKQVDEVQKRYAALEADPEVKSALAEARQSNGRIKLGPSDAFVAATRELDKAERQFLDKKPVARRKTTARSKR